MPDLATYALPPLAAMLLWWFSTGLILWLVRLPTWTRPVVMVAATGVLVVALAGIVLTDGETSATAAYYAFAAALAVWGWHEITFLLGLVTGPRKTVLTPGAGRLQRFTEATAAIVYHEAALALTAAALLALTWGAENQIAAWTFLALWVSRLSAKLNLFLGVPHFGDELMPSHLNHLRSYFAVRSMNLLFPVSVTVITAAAALLVARALHPGALPVEVSGLICLATLLVLGVLEHWFMVLPVRDAALWRWAAGRTSFTPTEISAEKPAGFEARPAPESG